ncbi:MAG: tetratricopeptide repeat protein [Nitrospira sp.]|nr:tetratricopeptide repeat protein [Nitrospira sp.]
MGSGANKAVNAAEIDRLALAVVTEPGSKAFIHLAEEYGKAGMWDEAAAVLEDGLTASPNFITAMVALGRVYEQLNQPAKAMAMLEEAVKLSPDNFRAHRTLAKIYAAQGVKEAGLRSCAVILAANPQDAEALSLHATLAALVVTTPTEPSHPQPAIEFVHPAPESVAAMENAKEPQPTAVIQGGHWGVTTESAAISPEQKSATVIQLEQWLTSVRARRRDPAASTDNTV